MGKIVTIKRAIKVAEELKAKEEKTILVGGCFDILHPAHIEFLERAKKLSGKLFVLLESDKAVKSLKGENRPINTQKDRAKALAALAAVDCVILLPKPLHDADYFLLAKKIKPDIIAITQGDPLRSKKEKQAHLVGGKVIGVMKRNRRYSTTELVRRFRTK